MPALIAPLSCRHAAYTAGRWEKARVKFGRWPRAARSVSYICVSSPEASPSGTVSMNVMTAVSPACLPARSDDRGGSGDRALIVVARLTGEQQARGLALGDDARLHRADVAPAGEVQQRVGAVEAAELLEVLDGGEDEIDLAALVGRERACRREPTLVDDLVAVDRRLLAVGQGREEEVGVEAHHDLRGRDPARELDERAGVGEGDAGLLLKLAHRRDAMRRVALALARIDGAAGEDPDPAHEARVGRPPDQQDLERVGPAAQQDDGRRLARHGLLVRQIEFLVGRGTVDLHGMKGTFRPMSETTTAQKWICDSCGFIYDPADGDPDGGIPPGTAFEDIPDTWFCPVCGARKRDFTPED